MTQCQINLDTLDQLRKQPGEVFEQLVRVYIEQSDRLIAAMPALLAQQQYTELQRHAHSIKSSSLNLGAEALAGTAQQLETLSEQDCNQVAPGQAQLQPLIEQIQQVFSALKPQLTEYR